MSKYLRKQRISEGAKIAPIPEIEDMVLTLQKNAVVPPLTETEVKQLWFEYLDFFQEYKRRVALLDDKNRADPKNCIKILREIPLPPPTRFTDKNLHGQMGISGKYLGINDTSSPLFKSRLCPKCNHLFIGNTKYCSHRCYLDSRYLRRKMPELLVYKKCVVCGKPMNKKAGAMVCSSACQKRK